MPRDGQPVQAPRALVRLPLPSAEMIVVLAAETALALTWAFSPSVDARVFDVLSVALVVALLLARGIARRHGGVPT